MHTLFWVENMRQRSLQSSRETLELIFDAIKARPGVQDLVLTDGRSIIRQ